ncbi:MAG: hypothetical protein ACLQU4_10935 [Limisphaerales bacterium]
MRIRSDPHAASYEAALTEEQRIAFHSLLLSGITLADAREKVPPWPVGPDKDKKPSIACLGKIRVRLRTEVRISRIEEAKATMRATRNIIKSLVNKTDQEMVLDDAMTLIGQQVIDACLELDGPSSKTTAAWLLLRRADQRRFDQRTAIFEAARAKQALENPPSPTLSEEGKEGA